MGLTKALRIGGSVMAAAGGVAGTYEVVTTVVEQINYEYQHVITETDTYFINGEEVTLEEYNAKKEANDAVVTKTEDKDIETIDDSSVIIYFGKATTLPKTLYVLNSESYSSTPASFTKRISCGNPDTEEGEYPIVAIPNTLAVESWKTSGFSLTFESYSIGNYDVYHLSTPSYDEDVGGIEYTIYFTVK